MYLLLLFILTLSSATITFGQCNSKVTAKVKTVNETRGEIVVEISTSENYICKLNAISGKGVEVIETQNGRGNKTIKFYNLDIAKIYQVDVEFTTEEKQLCKRLQKNNLIFEPN